MKNIFKLFALLLSICSFQTSIAATWTWVGGTSTAWNTKSNWSTASAAARPQAGDDVIINSGTFQPQLPAAYTITNLTINSGTLDVRTNNLTVSNRVILVGGSFVNNQSGTGRVITSNLVLNTSTGFTLGGSSTFLLQVNGTMTLTNGILYTNSNDILQFMAGSTVTGASSVSHVDGPVTKIGTSSFTFPVGSGTIYAPITMSTPASNSTYTAEYFPVAYSNTTSLQAGLDHVSNVEHWIFNKVSGANVNVTLSFTTARSGVVNSLTDLRVAKWDGTQWLNLGNGGTTGSTASGTVVNSTAITAYSPFTLGSSSTLNPLPIDLLSFTAELLNNSIAVKWSTANEINNHFFTVEKSLDGRNWFEISKINAAEANTRVNFYEILDLSPVAGLQYYRLKQNDINGQSNYYDKVAVNFSPTPTTILAYPNPCKDILTVEINQDETSSVSIMDQVGKMLINQTSFESGSLSFDLGSLPSGIYFLEVMVNNQKTTSKIIKK
jgi:hypothetical protein